MDFRETLLKNEKRRKRKERKQKEKELKKIKQINGETSNGETPTPGLNDTLTGAPPSEDEEASSS